MKRTPHTARTTACVCRTSARRPRALPAPSFVLALRRRARGVSVRRFLRAQVHAVKRRARDEKNTISAEVEEKTTKRRRRERRRRTAATTRRTRPFLQRAMVCVEASESWLYRRRTLQMTWPPRRNGAKGSGGPRKHACIIPRSCMCRRNMHACTGLHAIHACTGLKRIDFAPAMQRCIDRGMRIALAAPVSDAAFDNMHEDAIELATIISRL